MVEQEDHLPEKEKHLWSLSSSLSLKPDKSKRKPGVCLGKINRGVRSVRMTLNMWGEASRFQRREAQKIHKQKSKLLWKSGCGIWSLVSLFLVSQRITQRRSFERVRVIK